MASDAVIELTDDNFDQEVLQSQGPVLVDFWAEWCMPCRMLAPTIDQLADEYAGRVKIGKVDTDAHRDVAAKYDINSIPTIILFNAGKVAHTFVGVTPKQEFVGELDKVAS